MSFIKFTNKNYKNYLLAIQRNNLFKKIQFDYL